ncbi:MAG: hypothetical protein LBP79_01895 [Clostridiales bacterium]|jgi:hypothetical protein|nr:hypothetical protein [Clostridiales bacterium]
MKKTTSRAASLVSVFVMLVTLTTILTSCVNKNTIIGEWTFVEYDYSKAKSTFNSYVFDWDVYVFKKDGTCDAGFSVDDIRIRLYWSFDKKNKNWRIAEHKDYLEKEERWYETVEISGGKNMNIAYMKLKKKN